MAEALFESVCWNLKVFNAFGLFFTRSNLGLSSLPAASYLICWLRTPAVSLSRSATAPNFSYLSQSSPSSSPNHPTSVPPTSYLSPPKCVPPPPLLPTTHFARQEFDELVAIVPPALSLDLSPSNPIVELPSPESYEARRRSSTTYSVVLFHADWSRKSRELEITLSRLSSQYVLPFRLDKDLTRKRRYASPSLSFYLLSPDLAPQTFYDLSLSIQPTSLDLPALLLFRRGKVVARLPKGLAEAGEERRREKVVKRRGEREKREKEGRGEESESGSEEDGSDEERENEKRVAVERYRWDRSGVRPFLDAVWVGTKLMRTSRGVSSRRSSSRNDRGSSLTRRHNEMRMQHNQRQNYQQRSNLLVSISSRSLPTSENNAHSVQALQTRHLDEIPLEQPLRWDEVLLRSGEDNVLNDPLLRCVLLRVLGRHGTRGRTGDVEECELAEERVEARFLVLPIYLDAEADEDCADR